MKVLTELSFVINKNVGMVTFENKQSCCCLKGYQAVHFYSHSDVILFQQYLTLCFNISAQCQTAVFNYIPISSTILKQLSINTTHLEKLIIDNCNIPLVIDSLREVFQKCKQLVVFRYYDDYNLMTAEQLQSLFSQVTTLQNISLECNPNITSSSLEFMVQNSPLLTELHLNRTNSLDLTTLNYYMNNVKSNVKLTMN
jgi:hypothetical protein